MKQVLPVFKRYYRQILQHSCLLTFLTFIFFIATSCDTLPNVYVGNTTIQTLNCYGATNNCTFQVNNVTYTIPLPATYPATNCRIITNPSGKSTIIMGNTKIQNITHQGDSKTGILIVIGSNKTFPICGSGSLGYSVQSNIDNKDVKKTISNDIKYMENVSGCGSTCSTVKPPIYI